MVGSGIRALCLVLTAFASAYVSRAPLTPAYALTIDSTEEDVEGYDSIVNSLNRQVDTNETATAAASANTSRARTPRRPVSADPFENVWMHGGAGLVQVTQTVDLPNGSKAYLNQKGVQASLGLDLFSNNWMAEGTVRSFSDDTDRTTQVSLKEFELKILFKDRFAKAFGYRIGGGLSGRYMRLTTDNTSLEYTTPSSIGTVGFDLFLTDRFSIGADISGRSAMISDTIDRASLDGTLRLDAHF